MAQSRHDDQVVDAVSAEPEAAEFDRISSESKRQRERAGNGSAYGVRTGESDLLFFEGILPEESGAVMSDRSIKEQTDLCLERLESLLSIRDAAVEDVMKIEVQLTDMDGRRAVDEVYQAKFDGTYPPRTTDGVCSLPGNAAVQLDVIAADE
ncbi:RidA family protein [Natronolimnobius sp. AArcel1]|uniref:RidA family protein n=1 Tax=Natronolimnobius sp. AArcel1 TaxID=1679093 RepID=UPI0013EC6DCC|nr:RidA family protein [Natronolimnobius sp. AArcel1]NGM70540.1 RidA family protein [Natronolimnobius sp. AArcel1]